MSLVFSFFSPPQTPLYYIIVSNKGDCVCDRTVTEEKKIQPQLLKCVPDSPQWLERVEESLETS